MVIVGDGTPSVSPPNEALTEQDMKDLAVAAADTADAAGISVFTVFYDEADDDDAAAFFESLVRGDGSALRTPDPSNLPTLLQEICVRTSLKLVQ